MRTRAALLVLLLKPALSGGAVLAAQQASPYLPLGDWTMPYVEHLIAAGVIEDPSPLTRPLRRSDVLRAIAAADTGPLSPATRATLRQLRAALGADRGVSGARVRAAGALGVAAANYARRDPLSAIDSTGPRRSGLGHATANADLNLELVTDRFVVVTHPQMDTRLKYDPEWFGKKDRAIAGRTAEAYVAAQWKLAEIFFGRLDRNWGPAGVQGLLLSENPYGLDHLALSIGSAKLRLEAIATQLDDQRDSTGAVVHRFMEQHRLLYRPACWTLAVWEGSVLSGPDRSFETWYLNPLNLGLLEQVNNGGNVNSFVGLDFERRGRVTVFGQALLDDIQIDRKAASDLKPSSYAFTLGARGGVGSGGAVSAWRVFYTRVTNLTYRNEDNLQVPLYHELGTGRNFDDYDQLTLTVGLLPRAGLLLTPELTYLRQGEGDPRLPHPPVSAYPTTPTIFQGVVERTLRVALAGSYAVQGRVGLSFTAGVHRMTNFQHVAGDTRTRFLGSVGVSYRFRGEGATP